MAAKLSFSLMNLILAYQVTRRKTGGTLAMSYQACVPISPKMCTYNEVCLISSNIFHLEL